MKNLVLALGLTLYVYNTGQYSPDQLQHLQFTVWSTTNLALPYSQWSQRVVTTNQTWTIPPGQAQEFFRVGMSGH